MHLHGHKFWVMAQGNGYFNMSDYSSLPRDGRLVRDTVTVGEQDHYSLRFTWIPVARLESWYQFVTEAYGYVLIRFITDNPGMWAFHCHVSWHTEAGLLMQFLTRIDELANMKVSDASSALCLADDLEKGQGPDDAVYEDIARRWAGCDESCTFYLYHMLRMYNNSQIHLMKYMS